MSLQWRLSRSIPVDTAAIGQTVLRPDSVYRQLGDRFDELFPEESEFADLYQSTGRGAISPLLLALVTVFQALEQVPDRLAAEYVATRIDWKYSLHLPLTYTGFHFCDLSAFRQRLLEHKQERLVFEQLLQRLKALGLIKRRGKMRTDSTHVLAVVERLSQLELVSEALRVALGAVMDLDADWVEQHLPPAFREVHEARQSQYGLSQAQVQSKLAAVGRDGFWFLAQVDQSAPSSIRELAAVETLRRVLGEQFPSGPDSPAAAKRPSGDVIESPHETEARRGVKRGQGWTGYKAQVTETCDEDQPRLIVDLEPTAALANDSPQLGQIQSRLQAQDTLPGEQYVDQGYMSGKGIADSSELGIDLVGVPLADTQAAEGFRQADFDIDEAARIAVCPAGEIACTWSDSGAQAGQRAAIQIRFSGQTCAGCAAFGRCTSSAQGRSLSLSPYRKVVQERRAVAQTQGYQEKMHLRAGIEGTISELVRGHGLRSARYRGLAKLRLQCLFSAVAVNLKRLARWWTQPKAAISTAI